MSFADLGFQTVPEAPARPAPGKPVTGQPAKPPSGGDGAPAGGEPAGGGGFALLFPLLILIPFVLLMLWSSRSQQKKQKQMLDALKKGDRVLTQSGLVGKLVETDDRYAKVELAPGVKVQILKTSLLGRDTEETQKAAAQKK